MHWIPILLALWLYVFRAAFLPIIRSSTRSTPGSKRSQLHKMYQSRCTAKNSWWRSERPPETCRVVIPIQLEFSASVGFIHKESVTMHGHMIVKKIGYLPYSHVFNSRVAMTTVRHTKLLLHQSIKQIATYSGTDSVIIMKKVFPEFS